MRIIIKVKPNSREETIEEISPGKFVVSVKEPPVQGRANMAIIKVLQEYFHTKNVRIISGWTSRNKVIEVG